MASSTGSGTIEFTDEFHVDQDFGDDATADGTEARPFQTIQALLNMIGHPVDKQDACRKIKVTLHGAHSSGPQIIASQANDFDGIYQEGTLASPLWVPSRMITFFGQGVKIGNNTGSGYGNILQEISTGRRFGATSSEVRHTMTFQGMANCRDTHQRIRNGMHIGGNTRIAVIRRQIATIQGDASGPNDRVTITLTPGQFPYLPSVSQWASMDVTTQDVGDTVTYSSPNPIPNTTGAQGVFFKTLTGTTGVSVDTYYHVVNATPTTFQLSLTSGGAPLALTGDGVGVIMSRPGTLPFEPLIRIDVQGTTNYNTSYDIIEQISPTQFIAKRVTGTNTSSALESPVSAFFNETDSTGVSTQVTHDIAFNNAFQQGTLMSDDGLINGGAPHAGTCVVFAKDSRFNSGMLLPISGGSTGLLQRIEDCQINLAANNGATVTGFSRTTNVVTVTTLTDYSWGAGMIVTITSSNSGAQNIDGTWLLTGGGFGTFTFTQVGGDYGAQVPLASSPIATHSNVGSVNNISGSSFSGGMNTTSWTYSTDDMGLVGNRWNAGIRIHTTSTSAAPQVRMDANSAALFYANGVFTKPVTFTDAGDLVTSTNHGLWAGAVVRFTNITTTTGISLATDYYVVNPTTNTFQLALTPGGAAVALTTNGTGIMEINPSQYPAYIDLLSPTQMLVCQQFAQTSSVTVANTVTETGLTGAGVGMLNFPANFFKVGRNLQIRGSGFFSATASPTVRLRIKLGAVTILDTTAVVSLNETNRQFEFRADLTCRATGAGGNFFAQGVLTQYGALATLDMPMTNTAVSGAVNTTTAQALTVTLQWGTADPGNAATLTNLTIQG
jgi:hypothetical protein